MDGYFRDRGRLLFVAAAALAVVAAFALGRITALPSAPDDDSPEAGFARAMTIHHEQAVQMGMLAYQRSDDEYVRAMGYDIALSQQSQIGRMAGWLDDWGLPATSSGNPMNWMHPAESGEPMPGMASPAELAELATLDGHEFDSRFFELMIEHHIAGIDMAEAIIELTEVADVADLAATMVEAQRTEIRTMESMLQDRG